MSSPLDTLMLCVNSCTYPIIVYSVLGNSFRAPVDCKLPKGTTLKTLKNIHLPSNKDLKDQKFSFGVPMI